MRNTVSLVACLCASLLLSYGCTNQSTAGKPAAVPSGATPVAAMLPVGSAGMQDFARQVSQPVMEVPLVSAVVVDGEQGDAYDKAIAPEFVFLDGSKGTPKDKTTVHVVTTEEEIAIFFRCQGDTSKLVAQATGRDAGIWKDDYVEIFLSPQRSRDVAFYHVAVNSIGTLYDGRASVEQLDDASWNGDIRVKTKAFPNAWTAEIVIPLRSMGLTPGQVPKVWLGNFGHYNPTNGEDTAWRPTEQAASFLPSKFGYLWLDAGRLDNTK